MQNFLSLANLQQIEELRQQLLSYLIDASFVEVTPAEKQEISRARLSRGIHTRFISVPPALNVNANNVKIVGASLAAGLYPRLLSVDRTGGLRSLANQQPVSIHPSSINFRTPQAEFGTNFLAYFSIMQSTKLYAWETGPVDDKALALLCGDVANVKVSSSSAQIDKRLTYRIDPKSAVALKLLRSQVARIMSSKMRGKAMTESQKKWFELGMEYIMTEPNEEEPPGLAIV